MSEPLGIVVLGLTISSSWGNGHATTYRALLRGLSELGHRISFLERNVQWYAENRDCTRPTGCRLGLYDSIPELKREFGELVQSADVVIVGSYVPDGAEVLRWVLATARGLRLFYDIDTPITLAKLEAGEDCYLERESIPKLDAYLSFSGGASLRAIEERHGAALALPLYCCVDTERYTPTAGTPRRDLGYLGTYSADRQPCLERLLVTPARRWPSGRFVVAGPSYPEDVWPANVERIVHVSPADHAAFYGSLRYALNITRADMIRAGHSPSVRLFEAAACGTPVISDAWHGIEEFFEPGREILVASSAEQVLDVLERLPESERRAIGVRARQRTLQQHTAARRARQLDGYLRELGAGGARVSSTVAEVSSHDGSAA